MNVDALSAYRCFFFFCKLFIYFLSLVIRARKVA